MRRFLSMGATLLMGLFALAGPTVSPTKAQGSGAEAQIGTQQSEARSGPESKFNFHGRAITQQQARAMNLANQALESIQNSQWPVAMEILQQALAQDPDCPSALLNAGMVANQMGKFEDGIKYSSRVTEIAPERFEAWVNLGSSYQGAGKYVDAVRTFEQYLERFADAPKRAEIQSLVANMKMEIARQNAVRGAQQSTNSGPASGTDNDYFVYSIPDTIMKWSKDELPIKVFLPTDQQASSVDGYLPEYGQALRNAFSAWAEASKGAVSFKFVPQPQEANIECHWVSDPSKVHALSEGGDANIIANVGRGLQHVNITLLTHTAATTSPSGTLNTIAAVTLHEVGHSLGITGHSPDPADIMYGSVTDTGKSRHLTARDMNTLVHLYRPDVKVGGAFQNVGVPSGADSKVQLNNEATNLIQSGEFGGAIRKLEAALKLDPSFVMTKINLAVCLTNGANQLARDGKHAEALMQYKRALDLLKDDSDNKRKAAIMKNCAAMLYNTKRPAEAKEMEDAASKLLR